MDNKIQNLEIELAFLKDEVSQLNDIVASQQVLVDKLLKQNEELVRRIDNLDFEARPNRKPPHY